MSEKDNGGAAFPGPCQSESEIEINEGMTLRDYFGAKALAAIVAQNKLNPLGDFVADDGLLQHHRAADYAAITAYRFADAMLEARKK